MKKNEKYIVNNESITIKKSVNSKHLISIDGVEHDLLVKDLFNKGQRTVFTFIQVVYETSLNGFEMEIIGLTNSLVSKEYETKKERAKNFKYLKDYVRELENLIDFLEYDNEQ